MSMGFARAFCEKGFDIAANHKRGGKEEAQLV